MNDNAVFSEIPVDAITKGRDMVDVFAAYMMFHKRVVKVAAEAGKSEDETFANAMSAAIYRLYLLGVEDGMKRE